MKTKGKNIWIVPIYLLFYLVSFFCLEQMEVKHYAVHCALDQKISFCEYFIVPYILWFVFVAATVGYFAFFQESVDEYGRLIGTLAAGMTMFLIISFVCPNQYPLRVIPEGTGIFQKAVRLLQRVDTSTNVFPSIHVFNAVACCLALKNNKSCAKKHGLMAGVKVLTVLIILSTVFLKQHSVIDVAGALVMNWFCYRVFYKIMPENKGICSKILNREQVITIPNMLSLIRLALAILFWGISYRKELPKQQHWLVGILCVSGLTDYLDGKIARKCNMISEFGKILDPIADKVTQGVLLLHLLGRYENVEFLLCLFIIKEFCMLIMGSKALEEKEHNVGAQWYGKINTAVFYGVMIVLTLFPEIPKSTSTFLINLSTCFMLYAFIRYMYYYRGILATKNTSRKVC